MARFVCQAKLFPILSSQQEQQGSTWVAERVMWMQDVSEAGSDAADAKTPRQKAAIEAWLASERLSFKDILRMADPATEFRWKRHLEEQIAASFPSAASADAIQGTGR